MTISDKIRIYELSRDLNLENKDILDAAQKLSISVKSHSSSISAEEAKKIKNLINKKNSDKTILSICLLYTSPSPRDLDLSRMPSSA